MSSQSAGRRRNNMRQYSAEDQALNVISKEAEARLAAKRAARAEAREIRMKEIEKQEKESEGKQDRLHEIANEHSSSKSRQLSGSRSGSRRGSIESNDSDTKDVDLKKRTLKMAELRELEDKYKAAMMTSAQLDNEKQSFVYQVELLKDQLEEQDEGYTELQREHKEKCREYEFMKRDLKSMEHELNILKQQLEIKDKLIMATNDKGEPVLEKQSTNNGPLPSGAVLVSTETRDFLEKAEGVTLGTTVNDCNSRTMPSVLVSASSVDAPDSHLKECVMGDVGVKMVESSSDRASSEAVHVSSCVSTKQKTTKDQIEYKHNEKDCTDGSTSLDALEGSTLLGTKKQSIDLCTLEIPTGLNSAQDHSDEDSDEVDEFYDAISTPSPFRKNAELQALCGSSVDPDNTQHLASDLSSENDGSCVDMVLKTDLPVHEEIKVYESEKLEQMCELNVETTMVNAEINSLEMIICEPQEKMVLSVDSGVITEAIIPCDKDEVGTHKSNINEDSVSFDKMSCNDEGFQSTEDKNGEVNESVNNNNNTEELVENSDESLPVLHEVIHSDDALLTNDNCNVKKANGITTNAVIVGVLENEKENIANVESVSEVNNTVAEDTCDVSKSHQISLNTEDDVKERVVAGNTSENIDNVSKDEIVVDKNDGNKDNTESCDKQENVKKHENNKDVDKDQPILNNRPDSLNNETVTEDVKEDTVINSDTNFNKDDDILVEKNVKIEEPESKNIDDVKEKIVSDKQVIKQEIQSDDGEVNMIKDYVIAIKKETIAENNEEIDSDKKGENEVANKEDTLAVNKETVLENKEEIVEDNKEKTEAVIRAETKAVSKDATEAGIKEETEFISKEETEAVSKEETEAVSKEETEAVSKEETEAISKEETEFISKEETEAVSKEETEAISKEETEAVIREEMEAGIKEDTEEGITEETEAGIKEETDAVSKEETEAVITEETEAGIKEDTEGCIKEKTEASIKENTEAVIREETEAVIKEVTEAGIKEDTEACIKEDTEAGIKEDTEAGIKEDTEAGIKEDTEGIVGEETKAVSKQETDVVNKEETEAVKKEKTEAFIKQETESTNKEETEALNNESFSDNKNDSEEVNKEDTEAVIKEDTEAVSKEETETTNKEETESVNESFSDDKNDSEAVSKEETDNSQSLSGSETSSVETTLHTSNAARAENVLRSLSKEGSEASEGAGLDDYDLDDIDDVLKSSIENPEEKTLESEETVSKGKEMVAVVAKETSTPQKSPLVTPTGSGHKKDKSLKSRLSVRKGKKEKHDESVSKGEKSESHTSLETEDLESTLDKHMEEPGLSKAHKKSKKFNLFKKVFK
ncbi:leucine-rich repeat flightless-interacting protein 1 [Biomphalaria pfeifferi]|uniref:Leucine-rich repeat flightless-interacting protein 1 n=1 Tax=Biomphalaria pfeifferi TaxID=112525 RepID=A0AAD8BNF6_BIOPF|nr:leucine-rich repeat flightless-interacting protein 1 [Biomphalaria pfeifferi]